MITFLNGINGVVHDATSANFSGYCYDGIVVGSNYDDVAFLINGFSMKLPSGSSFNLKIGSISASTTGLYLLGTPINNMNGSENLP